MTSDIIYIIGSVFSVIITCAINYGMFKARIDNLEKKVDKHNNIIERTYVLEGKVKALEKTAQRKGK